MGHKRCADAVAEMLETTTGIKAVTVAGSDLLGSSSADALVELWNYLIRKGQIALADCLVNYAVRLIFLPFVDVTKISAFENAVESIDPDIIVCTVDAYNKALGTYAATKGIPFLTFITDTSVFLDNLSAHATHMCYFEETANAVRAFALSQPYFTHSVTRASSWRSRVAYVLRFYGQILHRGITSIYEDAQEAPSTPNDAECMTVGPLVSARHFAANERRVVRQRLGIEEGRDCVLVASGSIGGGFLEQVVDAVCAERSDPVTLLVMCGRDEATRLRIARRGETVGAARIMPVGYVEGFEDYLAAADCAVIRPSGGVFNECLVGRTPVVAPARVTSNDRGILTVVKRHGLGEVYLGRKGLVPALDKVLRDKEIYRQNIEVFLKGYPQTYEAITERIVDAIDAAAQRWGQAPLRRKAEREMVHSG